jgi:hypothetical protein
MPPAFVLSQDQTLKFIPGRLPSTPSKGLHNARINAQARRPTPPPAHPFLPSPPSQSTTPKTHPPQGGRAYKPSPRPRQHHMSALDGGASKAQQPVNVIVISHDVQGIIAKNRPCGQIRPRARSSTSVRSGGSAGAEQSGGASCGARYRQPWNGRHVRGKVGTSSASTSIRQ